MADTESIVRVSRQSIHSSMRTAMATAAIEPVRVLGTPRVRSEGRPGRRMRCSYGKIDRVGRDLAVSGLAKRHSGMLPARIGIPRFAARHRQCSL